MQIISKIAVDLASPGITPRIYGKQDDSGSRWVEIALYNSGVAFDVPDDAVLAVRYTGPTGAKGLYEWGITHNGNVVLCPLVDQIFAAAGRVTAELRIVDSQSSVTTWAFYIDVEGSKSADATLPPDYINQFTQIASQVAANAARAEAAADSIDTTQLLHYEDYDPGGDVKAAGGITAYVAASATPARKTVNGSTSTGAAYEVRYAKVGRLVFVDVDWPITGTGYAITLQLPYSSALPHKMAAAVYAQSSSPRCLVAIDAGTPTVASLTVRRSDATSEVATISFAYIADA